MNRMFELGSYAWKLAARVGDAFAWLSPCVARATVGWIFFQSGWGKLHDLAKVTDFFTELGIPAPAFHAQLTATTEFVCGSLILLGLCTRFAAVPLIVTMMVAIRTALWDQVESVDSLFGISEFLYIALLLWLATHGPGPLSIDHLIDTLLARRGEQDSPATLLRRRAAAA